MKKAILLVILLLSASGFSQNINDYKYIIVPDRFDFQDVNNQFNLNWLTKMMFEKYGFIVYHPNDILPNDLAVDRCRALYADVVKEPGFMRTNVIIKLKDCRNANVFTSEIGTSKLKDRKLAYTEALRDASKHLDRLNYNYSGKDITLQNPVTQIQDTPVSSTNTENLLTAKPIANGYQLFDASNKIVLKMYKTSQPDYYTAQMENLNGVVFRKDNAWFFEYYKDDKLVSQKLNIRF